MEGYGAEFDRAMERQPRRHGPVVGQREAEHGRDIGEDWSRDRQTGPGAIKLPHQGKQPEGAERQRPQEGQRRCDAPAASGNHHRQQGNDHEARCLDQISRRRGEEGRSRSGTGEGGVDRAEPVERRLLRMIEDQVADSADAVLHEFGALLVSLIDRGPMLPQLPSGGRQRDAVESPDDGEGKDRAERIDGDQQGQNEGPDQDRADRLDTLEEEVEHQQVDLVERGQMFAGMSRQVKGIGLSQQPPLHFNRRLMSDREGEMPAGPG